MGKGPYTEEFKTEAIRLVTEKNYSAAEASRNLGISPDTLHTWLKKTKVVVKDGKPSDLLEENTKLRRELKKALEERDILKKAAAYFANESH